MQLFLIRHAPAVERTHHLEDAARPLTPRGKKRWARAVAGMTEIGIKFDRLYHSPWLRAVETANVLLDLVDGETIATPLLAKKPSPALLEEIAGEKVALVGHEPWLSDLAAALLGLPAAAAPFSFKKGGVLWLEGEPQRRGMQLRAFLPPKVLRRLARA